MEVFWNGGCSVHCWDKMLWTSKLLCSLFKVLVLRLMVVSMVALALFVSCSWANSAIMIKSHLKYSHWKFTAGLNLLYQPALALHIMCTYTQHRHNTTLSIKPSCVDNISRAERYRRSSLDVLCLLETESESIYLGERWEEIGTLLQGTVQQANWAGSMVDSFSFERSISLKLVSLWTLIYSLLTFVLSSLSDL